MFEFMTIRKLYEMVFSNNHVEIDSLEYVQLQGWVCLLYTSWRWQSGHTCTHPEHRS